MKHLFYLFFFIISISFLTESVALPAKTQEYQLFEKEGKQGLKDDHGNILISPSYDELGWSKGGFKVVGKVVGYRIANQWGIISIENKVITDARYSQLYPGAKGLLIAGINTRTLHQRLGVVSVDGKTVLPFKYASVKLADLRAIIATQKAGKFIYGVVDLDNKTIIPSEYTDISFLGNLRFAVKNETGKTAIYNDHGKQILGFELDSISGFKNGFAIIYDNHLRGLINSDGKIIQPPVHKDFQISGQEVRSSAFNNWYVITGKNKVIKKMNYDRVIPFSEGIMRVEANGKTWLTDAEELPLTPKHYDHLALLENGFLSFRKGSAWGVTTPDYRTLLPARFDSVFASEDMIYVRERTHGKNVWSMYDELGVKKSRYYYNEIRQPSGYLYPVKRNEHWGFINRSGEEVIHCVYDEVSGLVDGLSAVKFHQEYGIIDKRGDWVVLPQKARIKVINDKYYITYSGKLTTLKSFEEGTVYFTENPLEIKDNYLLEHLEGGRVWKIDFQGRMVKPAYSNEKYEELRPPSEGFYEAKIDGKYGFVDAQNRLRIANRYDDVGPFSEGFAAIKLMGKWGFIDKKERLVVQPVYKHRSVFKNGLAIVAKDNGVGLITAEGKTACSFEYQSITQLDNGRFLAEKEGKYGLISTTGKIIINVKYQELHDLNNGFAIVKLFGKYGLVNLHGVDIIPVNYDQLIYDYLNNSYLGMKKSEWESISLP